MRVGFVLKGGNSWLGGRNYFRNLLSSIRDLPDPSVTPVLITDKRSGDPFSDLPAFELHRTWLLNGRSPSGLLRNAVRSVFTDDLVFSQYLKRHNVDLLSHSQDVVAGPTVGWIADFQHLHFPQFLSKEEHEFRSRTFLDLAKKCRKVILSSHSAKADFASFAPEFQSKASVLPFVVSPANSEHIPDLHTLELTYSFSGPYFLLPNQFWAHKNHRVVIEALKLLKLRGKPILVLTTGSTKDYRNPGFFEGLMEQINVCGVAESFRVLGTIPFDHLAGLMRNTVAFINPSLFEGWSTSVEESKSMGKSVILSDIPVHREQAPTYGVYFDPGQPDSLADAMEKLMQTWNPEEDIARYRQAQDELVGRRRVFAETYQQIMLDALNQA